jgi:hypothetical protein
MEKLRYMMRSVYQAHLIPLSSALIAPGRLIETSWGWGWPWNSNPTFRRIEGTAFDLLKDASADDPGYKSIWSDASVIEGSFSDVYSLDGKVSLAPLGLSMEVGAENARKVSIDIGEIIAHSFENGFAGHMLRRDLRALRTTDNKAYQWVNDDFFVTMAYHAASLRFTFEQKGDITAKAEFERAGAKVDVGVESRWENDHQLYLDGKLSVPFAVQGLRV